MELFTSSITVSDWFEERKTTLLMEWNFIPVHELTDDNVDGEIDVIVERYGVSVPTLGEVDVWYSGGLSDQNEYSVTVYFEEIGESQFLCLEPSNPSDQWEDLPSVELKSSGDDPYLRFQVYGEDSKAVQYGSMKVINGIKQRLDAHRQYAEQFNDAIRTELKGMWESKGDSVRRGMEIAEQVKNELNGLA